MSAMFAFQNKNKIFLEIITCNPSIYTLNHPDLTVSIFMEQSMVVERDTEKILHLMIQA